MELHSSLKPLDFAVITFYLISVLSLGFWVSFRKKHTEDLFLAGRRLGWANIGLSIFGTNVSPSMMIASCGVAYSTGIVAGNFEWLAWFFLLLLAMVFIPHYMTTKISTMPEFLSGRFGESCRTFLSWYTVFSTLILWLGGTLYAGGLLLGQIMGWGFTPSILFLIVIATSFTVTGGLTAVVITDSFQSILIIGSSAALTIITFLKIGSIEALVNSVPADYWRLFRSAGDPEYPWPAILLGYPVLGVWFWCTDQTIVQRVLGGRDIRQGQLGSVFAAYLKILTPFIFLLPGIFCKILHPGLEDPDEAYTTLVVNYLPAGMVGLIVAVLIAALISTIDSGLNSLSTVFTLDIYCKVFRKNAANEEIAWTGRVVTIAAAVVAVFFALALESVEKMNLFDLLQSIISFLAPPMAAVFLVGVLWSRATSAAALSTLVVGTAISLSIGGCYLAHYPSDEFWPHFLLLSFYLFATLVPLMVLVSLVTKPPSADKHLPSLKEAYARSGHSSKQVWMLWAFLAAIMFSLYVFFN